MTDIIEKIRARHKACDHIIEWPDFDSFEAYNDRATLLRILSEERAAVNALPELLAEVKRLEADLQVIAFGWRYVAEPDNSFTKVDWTRDQLIEYARAALNQKSKP